MACKVDQPFCRLTLINMGFKPLTCCSRGAWNNSLCLDSASHWFCVYIQFSVTVGCHQNGLVLFPSFPNLYLAILCQKDERNQWAHLVGSHSSVVLALTWTRDQLSWKQERRLREVGQTPLVAPLVAVLYCLMFNLKLCSGKVTFWADMLI